MIAIPLQLLQLAGFLALLALSIYYLLSDTDPERIGLPLAILFPSLLVVLADMSFARGAGNLDMWSVIWAVAWVSIPPLVFTQLTSVFTTIGRQRTLIGLSWAFTLIYVAYVTGFLGIPVPLGVSERFFGTYVTELWSILPFLGVQGSIMAYFLYRIYRSAAAQGLAAKSGFRRWFAGLIVVNAGLFMDALPALGLPMIPLGYIFLGPLFYLTVIHAWRFSVEGLNLTAMSRQILDTMLEPLVVTDASLRVRLVNPAFEKVYGFSRQELAGRHLSYLLYNRFEEMDVSDLIALSGKENEIFNSEGEPVDVLLSASSLVELEGSNRGIVLIVRDITLFKTTRDALQSAYGELEVRVEERTSELSDAIDALRSEIAERERFEAALRESESRYALAVRGANDGLFDWNLDTGEIYFSARWKEMLGFNDDEIPSVEASWFERIHEDDSPGVRAALDNHFAGLTSNVTAEFKMLHQNGEYRWMAARGVALRNGQGNATRFAGSMRDVTARKDTESRLIFEAYHDGLTRLPNRAMLLDRLKLALSRYRHRDGDLFALLFLDLDRFKLINDSMGHLAGDQVLVKVAERLQSCIREEDMVARLGGDEFVVLLEHITGVIDATHTVQRLQESLWGEMVVAGAEMHLEVSIGIALAKPDYESPEEVLRDADTALYRAKEAGKDRYAIFDEKMHQEAMTMMRVEADLRKGLERDEFFLVYQPIVRLPSGDVEGFEALLRWRHADRGVIPPNDFIELAEESGIITRLGHWVLREACFQTAAWQKAYAAESPLTVSVNIAAKQLTPQLVKDVSAILEESGLAPSSLILEINERSVIRDEASAIDVLGRIKAKGVMVHLDDFGEGYSSLSILHKLPIDTMKIDKSFVTGLHREDDKSKVVRAIVNLGHHMKKTIIAEGIESREEAEQLHHFACEKGQGFYYSKPLNPEDIPEAILEGRT